VVNAPRHELHLQTGSYALGALPAAELAAFERHLDQCLPCAEETRGLRETAARLGMATAIAPPPRMRERVLAAAMRTRQLPPPGRKLLPFSQPRPRRRPRYTLPRPALAVAITAMAAAIAALLVLQISTQHQLQQAQAGNRAVAAVLAAPDARIQTSATTVGGTVTAVISPRDHQAVITTTGMPALPASKTYQLWVISPSGARSAGLLPAPGTSTTPPILASGISPGDHLGITIEHAGGATHPTTKPLVLLPAPT